MMKADRFIRHELCTPTPTITPVSVGSYHRIPSTSAKIAGDNIEGLAFGYPHREAFRRQVQDYYSLDSDDALPDALSTKTAENIIPNLYPF